MPPRPPPAPSVPASPAARQREAARLLTRLDDHLKRASDLSAIARERVGVGGLNRYRRFTKRVRDFFALAALVEERLDLLPEEMGAPQMMTALDRMHARMVLLFIDGSVSFFGAYSKVEELPIGTHEMCGLELRGLTAIRAFLDDPRYDGERGRALRQKADQIADLMRMVMDRVPPLPDFGDLPSVSPKGGYSKPIKAAKRPAPPPARAVPPPAAPAARSEDADSDDAPPRPPEVRELSLDDFTD